MRTLLSQKERAMIGQLKTKMPAPLGRPRSEPEARRPLARGGWLARLEALFEWGRIKFAVIARFERR